jgi:hypothetical protein
LNDDQRISSKRGELPRDQVVSAGARAAVAAAGHLGTSRKLVV